ncbi:MAG: ribosomal-processing cysteine protease Prp [Spirochaetaceae bacterium]|nr:MAG: ribosomal-processing cysteine protease Prp [Spirochaetaceae bacterium]
MLRVDIRLDKGGCVRRLQITGHFGLGRAGNDPGCAAVSVLAKAWALTLMEGKEHKLEGQVERPGEFLLEIVQTGDMVHAKIAGRMLQNGLDSVRREFPDNIEIEILDY